MFKILKSLKTISSSFFGTDNKSAAINTVNSPDLFRLFITIFSISEDNFLSPLKGRIATLYGSSVPWVISKTNSEETKLEKIKTISSFFILD